MATHVERFLQMGLVTKGCLAAGAASLLVGCTHAPALPEVPAVPAIPLASPDWSGTPPPSPEQQLVDRSAEAVAAFREKTPVDYAGRWLERARGVMVFPDITGSTVVSGDGVLLAHHSDGTWSPPAFYSLQVVSPSISHLIPHVSLVLMLMDASTLNSAIWGLEIGKRENAPFAVTGSVRAGIPIEPTGKIYGFITDGRSVWSVPVDGVQVSPSEGFDRAYYNPCATTYAIVMEQSHGRPDNGPLCRALTVQATRD